MKSSRRQFIVHTLLMTLGSWSSAFAGNPAKQTSNETTNDAAFETAFADMQQKIIEYYQQLGHEQIPRQSIITNHAFNDGLRYDESGTLAKARDGKMIIQDCARIDDIPLRGRHDILPYFHIFGFNRRADTHPLLTINELLNLLVGTIGFTPQHIALVSIDVLKDYQEAVAKQGIDWQRQVVIRDTEKAKAAGDGSGYFKPANHPEEPEAMSAGIYIWTGKDTPSPVKTYPLPEQWTEIGELILGPDSTLAFGLGLERLVYAKTGLKPSWHEQRQVLLSEIEAETAKTGDALPKGYYLFKDTTS